VTDAELRELLKLRVEQADSAIHLITERPHDNGVWMLTLKMAARELKHICEEFLHALELNEERVKATLYPLYQEFLRCRSRIVADFYEIDHPE
jgi:hypothetical protein